MVGWSSSTVTLASEQSHNMNQIHAKQHDLNGDEIFAVSASTASFKRPSLITPRCFVSEACARLRATRSTPRTTTTSNSMTHSTAREGVGVRIGVSNVSSALFEAHSV